jgi:uncharacterized membrane protein
MVVFHVVSSLVAALAGLLVILLEKGTPTHRRVGKVYASAMYALCGSSFFIFETSGTFSFFHVVSIQNIVLTSAGISVVVYRKRIRNWPVWHLRFMLYSYIALIATGTLQFLEYLPFQNKGLNVVTFCVIPAVTGFVLVQRSISRWTRRLRGPALAGSGSSFSRAV